MSSNPQSSLNFQTMVAQLATSIGYDGSEGSTEYPFKGRKPGVVVQ